MLFLLWLSLFIPSGAISLLFYSSIIHNIFIYLINPPLCSCCHSNPCLLTVPSSSSSDLHTLVRLWLPWPGHSSGWTLLSPSLCSHTHARLLFLWILPLSTQSPTRSHWAPLLCPHPECKAAHLLCSPNGFRTGLSRKTLARKGLWMGGAEKGKEGLCAASDINWNWPGVVAFLPNQLTNQPSFIPRSLC